MDFAMTEKEKKNGNEIIKRHIAFLKAKQTMKPTRKKQPERDERQMCMIEFAE